MKHTRPIYQLSCCGTPLQLGHRTLVMGVLNVTPDSFSDGGLYFEPLKAIDRARALVEAGADIIDIGGESSRPAGPYGKGATVVSLKEELDRTIPIIEALAPQLGVPISIDTTKSEVARQAIDNGATIVNDISALRFDHRHDTPDCRNRSCCYPHAHAGNALNHATEPCVRRCRIRYSRLFKRTNRQRKGDGHFPISDCN